MLFLWPKGSVKTVALNLLLLSARNALSDSDWGFLIFEKCQMRKERSGEFGLLFGRILID
jgi:hypothetical protein